MHLYGCIPSDNGNYGTLTLNLPMDITQVGALSVGPAPVGNGQIVQGFVNIASDAPLGSGSAPPQIGLNQSLDGNNNYSNKLPYYLTQWCASGITLASQTQEIPFPNSPFWNMGYRTGVGEYAAMQATPITTIWNNSDVWENVNPVAGSDSCAASVQTSNICQFNALHYGYFGDAIRIKLNGAQEGPTNNVLWDEHTFYSMQDVLSGSGQSECTATCKQWYYCGNNVMGNFSIQYTLDKPTPIATYTSVSVTKSTVH